MEINNKYWVVVEVFKPIHVPIRTLGTEPPSLFGPDINQGFGRGRGFDNDFPDLEPPNFISGGTLRNPLPEIKLIGIYTLFESAQYAVSGYSNRKILGPQSINTSII